MSLQLVIPAAKSKLTGQQELFAHAYVVMTPSKAYLEAGYPDNGNRGDNIGKANRLARTPKIKARIEYYRLRLGQRMEEIAINAMANLQAIINVSVKDVTDKDGNALPPHLLPDWVASAVSEYKLIETELGQVASYKFHSKLPAIRLAMQNQGLLEQDRQASAPRVVLELGQNVKVNKIVSEQ